MQRGSVIFAVLLASSTAGIGGAAARAQAGADLSGTWILNTELSDDVQEEFRRWAQARGGPGGAGLGAGGAAGGGQPGGGALGAGGSGADPGGGGDDAGGGGFGGGRPRSAAGGLLGMMQGFSQGIERLTITQSGDEVTITNAEGVARTVFTDGRVIESEDEKGGKTKVRTRWKKERMIVDVDFPPRPSPLGGNVTPSLTMSYSVDKNGRLELLTTVGAGAAMAPFSVERVYDREAPAG